MTVDAEADDLDAAKTSVRSPRFKRAGTSAVVLRLKKTKIDEIEAISPTLAIALHKIFVELLASRLAHANLQTAALRV
jgi:CRP-like cAMP-binding protein